MAKEIAEKDEKYDVKKDRDLQTDDRELQRNENPNPLFKAGQSNRVWGELYKVCVLNLFISKFLGIGFIRCGCSSCRCS